jgi:hypothetical protein
MMEALVPQTQTVKQKLALHRYARPNQHLSCNYTAIASSETKHDTPTGTNNNVRNGNDNGRQQHKSATKTHGNERGLESSSGGIEELTKKHNKTSPAQLEGIRSQLSDPKCSIFVSPAPACGNNNNDNIKSL